MSMEAILIILFSVATAVALVARRLRLPYTVALVLAGLALGSTKFVPTPHLTKELLYSVFLPGLLFEASFHLEFKNFWANKMAISALAVPGVVASVGLTAVLLTPAANALHFVEDFTMRDGLVFAALLAATDPIAVVSLFKSLGAPKRMAVLVEGESLLNDGTAVVVFTLLLSALGGATFSPLQSLVDFIRIVGVGILIGLTIGLAVTKVIQQVDDPMLEITLTTIGAYGSFVAAEAFHFSGVIATVTAGMLCGNYAARTGMSPSTRVAVQTFWEYVAFALNSIVFLLIGLEVNLSTLRASAVPILIAFGVVTASRAIVVSFAHLALRRSAENFPFKWTAVLTWGGLRGGLSMVLVLALPPSFVHRELLVTLTFGVVVLSILVQGLTMAPLLRWLGLARGRADRVKYERRIGELRGARAGLEALDRAERTGTIHSDIIQGLRDESRGRITALEQEMREAHVEQGELRLEEEIAARRQILMAEKDAIHEAVSHGVIGGDASAELLGDVDSRLVGLDERAGEH
jgi:monovalent cation:H+ antiporter, CPA1 family